LSNEEQQLNQEVKKYKAILGQKKKEIKALDEKIAGLRKVYNEKERTLISVYDKKINYRLKSNQLAAFADELSRYGLHSDRMMTQEDKYAISIIAENDRNITELVRQVTDKYAKEIRMIDIEKIASDENGSLYHGILKVELQ
jgi:DNA gyrase/topoisomerase IV subunit A